MRIHCACPCFFISINTMLLPMRQLYLTEYFRLYQHRWIAFLYRCRSCNIISAGMNTDAIQKYIKTIFAPTLPVDSLQAILFTRTENTQKPLLTLLFFTLFLVLPPHPLNAEEQNNPTVPFTTLEWPPYISTELPSKGYVAKVVREALHISGYNVSLEFLPWARAIRAVDTPDKAGYLPEYYAERLKDDCVFSDPFPGGPLSLVTMGNLGLPNPTVSDLENSIVGVVRGYVNTRWIDNNDAIIKEEAVDDLSNLRKLEAGRVNYIIGDPYVLEYLHRKHFTDQSRPIRIIEPPLSTKQLYICFSKNYPNHEAILQAFNNGLATMEQNDRLDALFASFQAQYTAPPLPSDRQ